MRFSSASLRASAPALASLLLSALAACETRRSFSSRFFKHSSPLSSASSCMGTHLMRKTTTCGAVAHTARRRVIRRASPAASATHAPSSRRGRPRS